MADGVTIKLLNSATFERKIKAALNAVGDLRPEFLVIANMWYKDNIQLFNLKGPGQYEDYKADKDGKMPSKYMLYKKRKTGNFYPLLKFSGKLAASILNPDAPGAVRVIEANKMVVGTSVPYAIYHQLGTEKMPARPPIINEESGKHGQVNIVKKRQANYLRVIETGVRKRLQRSAK